MVQLHQGLAEQTVHHPQRRLGRFHQFAQVYEFVKIIKPYINHTPV